MYAVIKTGGKQYRVAEGDVVRIEKLEAEPGAAVEFDKVVLVGKGVDVKIGVPFVTGSKVSGTVQKHGQTDKVPIVKFRRRKHYLRQGTHRQLYTEVKITGIQARGPEPQSAGVIEKWHIRKQAAVPRTAASQRASASA